MSASCSPTVAVVGSINMDLVVRTGTLPRPGETCLAEESQEVCGGKGANQAVAAARAGAKVSMIGRVGDDSFSQRLMDNLCREQIDCGAVQTTEHCASGLAVVAVEHSGQNAILVVPGANSRLTEDDVRSAQSVIRAADVLLVQLEIPLPAVHTAIRLARQAEVRIVFDPAPVSTQLPADLFDVDVLCPNESEAAALCGFSVDSDESAGKAAQTLYDAGARRVVITRGNRGTVTFDGRNMVQDAAFPVDSVDTTAAGDAFAGALAVRWAEGADFLDAVRFASAAGACAASRPGAQPAMPQRTEIDALLKG